MNISKNLLLFFFVTIFSVSQERIQELLNEGVHINFNIENTSSINHFESSEYKILISDDGYFVQIGIWEINDHFKKTPLKVFKKGVKMFDGRLGAYYVYFHDVSDTFNSFSNFIEIYNDAGTSPDGWHIYLNTYYFSSRLPFIKKLYDYYYQTKIRKSGKHKKYIRFNYVWYYSGCSG